MLKFAWRWARVGDLVLVRQRRHLEKGQLPGTVAVVTRVDHGTRLGIRFTRNGDTNIIGTAAACAHPDALDDESSWMCDEQPAATRITRIEERAA